MLSLLRYLSTILSALVEAFRIWQKHSDAKNTKESLLAELKKQEEEIALKALDEWVKSNEKQKEIIEEIAAGVSDERANAILRGEP